MTSYSCNISAIFKYCHPENAVVVLFSTAEKRDCPLRNWGNVAEIG